MKKLGIDIGGTLTDLFTDYSDGDGVTNEPIKIQVAVLVTGSEVTVDFTGSHPQTIGGMNVPLGVTHSSLEYSIMPDRAGAGTFRGGAPVRRVTRSSVIRSVCRLMWQPGW